LLTASYFLNNPFLIDEIMAITGIVVVILCKYSYIQNFMILSSYKVIKLIDSTF